MKLNPENLAKFRTYFLEGGSTEYTDVAKFLNVQAKDEKGIDEAIDQLFEKYPKLKEEVEAANVERNKPQVSPIVPNAITKVILMDETGFGQELRIVANKNGKLVVEKIVPKDEVIIKIKGEDVVVDLLKLRKMLPTEQMFGVSVATLILMGEIAKAA